MAELRCCWMVRGQDKIIIAIRGVIKVFIGRWSSINLYVERENSRWITSLIFLFFQKKKKKTDRFRSKMIFFRVNQSGIKFFFSGKIESRFKLSYK